MATVGVESGLQLRDYTSLILSITGALTHISGASAFGEYDAESDRARDFKLPCESRSDLHRKPVRRPRSSSIDCIYGKG